MSNKSSTSPAVSSGLSFGSALAIVVSWSINKHLGWAILHGIFSWGYVIYYWLGYAGNAK